MQRIKEGIRKIDLFGLSLHSSKIKIKSKRIVKCYSINFSYYKQRIYYKN